MNDQRYKHKLVKRCKFYEDVRAEIVEHFPVFDGLTLKQINTIFSAFVGCDYREEYWDYIVKLVSAGADVNAIHRSRSILSVITGRADVAKTRFLLDHGATPSSDALDACIRSPQRVHTYAHMEITRMLISVAGDHHLWNLCSRFAYDDTGIVGYSFDIALILLEAGCGEKCETRSDIRGYTMLASYSDYGRNMELFKMVPHDKSRLSKALADIIHSYYYSMGCVNFLLFNGADPNIDVRYRVPVIREALWYSNKSMETVKLLLQAGAHVKEDDLRIKYPECFKFEESEMIAMMIEAI